MLSADDPIRLFHVVAGETSLGAVPYKDPSIPVSGSWRPLSASDEVYLDGSTSEHSSGHSEYLTNGKTSQRNLAAVVTDRLPTLTPTSP